MECNPTFASIELNAGKHNAAYAIEFWLLLATQRGHRIDTGGTTCGNS